ncbi:MAG: hypothetical protein V2A79_17545 [Planctomycetota bacterium]
MVLGYHVILGMYGFWLPNDPRGSWSDFVRSWGLYRFAGPATKTEERRSVAHDEHNARLRRAAKQCLCYPPVRLNGLQARAIGRGFGRFVERSGLDIWACSILPEHVHLVIGRHRYVVEQAVNLLRGAASRQLLAEGLHPFAGYPKPDGATPSIWGRGLWKVFLDTPEDVRRAIQYVQENPVKEGKPAQKWWFVKDRASEASGARVSWRL